MPLDPVARKLLDEVAASGRPNAHLLPVAEARANFESLFAGSRSSRGRGCRGRSRHSRERGCHSGALLSSGRCRHRPAARRLLPRRRLAARVDRLARRHLPLARQRLGRRRAERRLPARAGAPLPRGGRRRARCDALGARERRAPRRRPGETGGRGRLGRRQPRGRRLPGPARRGRADRPLPATDLPGHDGRPHDRLGRGLRGLLPLSRRAVVAPGALPRVRSRCAQPARLAPPRRSDRPPAGRDPGRRMRSAAPAGGALPRSARCGRGARRIRGTTRA